MLVTSLTTSVSFLATTFSPILPICGFGIFSGIVIAVNYLLIMIALPCIQLCYEMYIAPKFNCFNFATQKLFQQEPKDLEIGVELDEGPSQLLTKKERLLAQFNDMTPLQEVHESQAFFINYKDFQMKK